jgi:hypothetical protein
VIRKSYAALRNLVTSLPNPNPDPNPNISGQVESESEENGSDPHHWKKLRICDMRWFWNCTLTKYTKLHTVNLQADLYYGILEHTKLNCGQSANTQNETVRGYHASWSKNVGNVEYADML